MQNREIAQRVYDWENNCVEPKAVGFLSRDECHELVDKACTMSGILKPSIRISKSAFMSCRAVPAKWQLVFSGWGRTGVTVLHEVAHLATIQAILRGEDAHGPSFVGQAIEFYHRILGVDLEYLVRTANEFSISVRMPNKEKVLKRSTFEAVDF